MVKKTCNVLSKQRWNASGKEEADMDKIWSENIQYNKIWIGTVKLGLGANSL